MTDPIDSVQIDLLPDRLRLTWMLMLEAGRWRWPQPTVEVRLYCDHTLVLGRPDLHQLSLPADQLRVGIAATDANGQFHPITFDLDAAEIPAGSSGVYASLEWPVVSPDWLRQSVTVWAIFGYTEDETFIPLHESNPVEHQPAEPDEAVSLPPATAPLPTGQRPRQDSAAPNLFISYARHDAAAVAPIARRLNREYYYDVWIDFDSIPGGARWQDEIASGIAAADRVLFILTPYACRSRWCRAELDRARELGKPIIPLRLTTAVTQADVDAVGLGAINWIEFASEQPDWDKLLRDGNLIIFLDGLAEVPDTEPDARSVHCRRSNELR